MTAEAGEPWAVAAWAGFQDSAQKEPKGVSIRDLGQCCGVERAGAGAGAWGQGVVAAGTEVSVLPPEIWAASLENLSALGLGLSCEVAWVGSGHCGWEMHRFVPPGALAVATAALPRPHPRPCRLSLSADPFPEARLAQISHQAVVWSEQGGVVRFICAGERGEVAATSAGVSPASLSTSQQARTLASRVLASPARLSFPAAKGAVSSA
nr:uncharacterized protein LOC116281347 [Vicugna pacos]